ncbi:MAG: hypothetical protein HZA54_20690 [Planctomycetes bacterium]|nr:hypothetical protein [Planctomycetota bacterium]
MSETSTAGAPLPAPAVAGDPGNRRFYRICLISGFVAALTAGAAWGAQILVRVAAKHSFSSIPHGEIDVHAHAAVAGWVALPVFAFAFFISPRPRRAAAWAICAYLPALLLRMYTQPRADADTIWLPITLGLCAVQALASGILLLSFWDATGNPSRPAPWQRFLQWSLLWFFAATLYDPAALYLTETALQEGRAVTAWAPALRQLQINGFCILLLLGIGQQVLPAIYGAGRTSAPAALSALTLANFVIAAEVIWRLVVASLGIPVPPLLAVTLGPLFYLAVVLVVGPWNIFRSLEREDETTRFHRAAVLWLHVGLLMYLFEPLLGLSPDFRRVYYAAATHALGLGFVGQSLLAYTFRTVPLVSGISLSQLARAETCFYLLNLGCAIRVVFQVLSTDYDCASFAFEPLLLSALLELTAVGMWGGLLFWKVLNSTPGAAACAPSAPSVPSAPADRELGPSDTLRDAALRSPEARAVLGRFGFRCAEAGELPSFAGRVCLREACLLHDVDERELLAALAGRAAPAGATGGGGAGPA